MKYFLILCISTALFITACSDGQKTKPDNHPQNAVNDIQPRRINPKSCYGAVGLDWMSEYAPTTLYLDLGAQSKQRKYLAWTYFSGTFQHSYPKIIEFSQQSAARNWPDQKPVDRLFGNIIPIAYEAMCMEDLVTLQWSKTETQKIETIFLSHWEEAEDKEYIRLALFAKFLLWENDLATAKIKASKDELLDIRESMRGFILSNRSVTGRIFLLPKSEMAFSEQMKKGYYLSRIDQARFELLEAELLIALAIEDNDIDLLLKVGRTFEKLDIGFGPKAKPNQRISTGYAFDAPPFSGGYYTRAIVYYKWMEAILALIDNEDIRRKQGPKPIVNDYTNSEERQKRRQYVDLDPGVFGSRYNILYGKSRQFLLYDNSTFLWALRHNLHAQLHIEMMTAPPSKNMVGERKPPLHSNTNDHCHAYQSLVLVQQVIPSVKMTTAQKTWCDKTSEK